MAKKPTVRWNEQKQRWMAWVRFPDGSRRKVERGEKADAQRDLDALITLRAQEQSPDDPRVRMATFADVTEGVVLGRVSERGGEPEVAARTREVTEHDRQRTTAPRHVRVAEDRLVEGRPHDDPPARGAVGVDGPDARHEHDRPQLELPQPGLPARVASATHQDEPRRRRAAAGDPPVEAPQELRSNGLRPC